MAVPDLPIGYLGPQDPRGPPTNCGTHWVNGRYMINLKLDWTSSKIYVLIYSRNLVVFNFRGNHARVFQRVPMNLNMTVGQGACQLLCWYTQSTFAASCVCWIVPIVTCDSIKTTFGCSCLKCTWSVA